MCFDVNKCMHSTHFHLLLASVVREASLVTSSTDDSVVTVSQSSVKALFAIQAEFESIRAFAHIASGRINTTSSASANLRILGTLIDILTFVAST